jgi:bifunctional non-homologous end joining protein LigD
MPLHWKEVKKGLTIQSFNIATAVARVKEQGDIFEGVMGKGIDLEATVEKIESLFGGG